MQLTCNYIHLQGLLLQRLSLQPLRQGASNTDAQATTRGACARFPAVARICQSHAFAGRARSPHEQASSRRNAHHADSQANRTTARYATRTKREPHAIRSNAHGQGTRQLHHPRRRQARHSADRLRDATPLVSAAGHHLDSMDRLRVTAIADPAQREPISRLGPWRAPPAIIVTAWAGSAQRRPIQDSESRENPSDRRRPSS